MRRFKFPNRSIAIAIAIFILCVNSASAQYIKLRDFGAFPEGVNPYAPLVDDGTFLYGITANGGANTSGAIYKFNPTDGKVTVIHDFAQTQGSGAFAAMILDGGALYGTALTGGANGHGYIYKLNTDGSNFTNIFDFNYGVTGGYPYASLITDGSVFYGVTTQGGSKSYGVVFKINKDGSGYTKLYEFDYNTSGGSPESTLAYDGTYLYGTTSMGGSGFGGTVYRVKTDGTGFETLKDFIGSNGSTPHSGVFYDGTFLWCVTQVGGVSNNGLLFRMLPDGSSTTVFSNFNDGVTGDNPRSTLISDGTFLYGTTTRNGGNFGGTVFKIKLDGSLFSKVIDLDQGPFGQTPEGTLTLKGSTLFGTRSSAGHSGSGAIFQVNTDGTNYQLRHSFAQEGSNPAAELVSDGTYLYGVTERGGEYNNGTIYRVKPDGTAFETIVDFDGPTMGSLPLGRVYYDGTKLFGMTSFGGTSSKGTIYFVDKDGSNFTKILDFDGMNRGDTPWGALISDGTYLYGTTLYGGVIGKGVVFKIMPNGSNFTKLHDFVGGNSDGAYPYNNLLLEGGVLYATTNQGSYQEYGTVFKMNTDGSGFQIIHAFTYDDGAYPSGSLYSDGTFLYGLTTTGGKGGFGTAFKVQKDGSGFVDMIDLTLDATGGNPNSSFISDGTHLYFVTNNGGVLGKGALLKVAFDGTHSRMMDFSDGSAPRGSLYSDGTFLYGVTQQGGKYTVGTLYKRSLAPAATIVTASPQIGTAGTYVTIVGNDFDPDPASNDVKFGGTAATVVSATADSLVVLVPEGATTGPISVATNSTSDISTFDFEVTDFADMFNGKVRTCSTTFTGAGGDDELVMTFEPGTPGAKLTVDFYDVTIDDYLEIYDGPDMTNLVGTLGPGDEEFTYTSTAPGGELTFHWVWEDEDSDWEADITCGDVVAQPLTITAQPGDKEVCQTEDALFITVASGPNDITFQWQSSKDEINWTDLSDTDHFTGSTKKSLTVMNSNLDDAGWYRCNISGGGVTETTNSARLVVNNCNTTQLVVYNAVSPNNDGKNEFLLIENIDVIPSKIQNTVKIYNRWGDEVFAVANYNNKERVFNGHNKNGNKLPSGTYFYKITFTQDKEITGYLELKY